MQHAACGDNSMHTPQGGALLLGRMLAQGVTQQQ